MTQTVSETTDSDLEHTLQTTQTPVLLEFYTQNCPHCRRLEPILENAVETYGERLRFLRMDAQTNQTRPQHGLSGTPTLVLYKDGEEVVTKTGAMRDQQLRAFLDHYL